MNITETGWFICEGEDNLYPCLCHVTYLEDNSDPTVKEFYFSHCGGIVEDHIEMTCKLRRVTKITKVKGEQEGLDILRTKIALKML